MYSDEELYLQSLNNQPRNIISVSDQNVNIDCPGTFLMEVIVQRVADSQLEEIRHHTLTGALPQWYCGNEMKNKFATMIYGNLTLISYCR